MAYQLVLIDFNIEKYLQEILEMINDFLHNEFDQRVVAVVSFLNELLFILQVKYQNPAVQALVIKR